MTGKEVKQRAGLEDNRSGELWNGFSKAVFKTEVEDNG